MAGSNAALASGSRVTLAYVREEPTCRGVTPAAVNTPTDLIPAEIAVSTTGGVYTRSDSGGSWITDGFAVGQSVTIAGFTNSENNGTFVVTAVTATVLTFGGQTTVVEATPPGNCSFQIRLELLRTTSRQVNLTKNTLDSAEVRASGQRADSRHGFVSINGSPGFQLSITDFDDLFELALRNTFATVTIPAITTVAFTSTSGTSTTMTVAGADLVTAGVRPGDFITVAGAVSANNGRYRVVTISYSNPDTTITAVAAIDGATPENETANASTTITYPGKRIDLGNTLTTWTVERQFGDITEYQPFRGVGVNSLQMNVTPEAIITGALTLLGLGSDSTDEGKLNSSSISGSDPLAASSNAPMAAFDGSLFEGGTEIAVVTSFDFTIALNRSLEPVVGSKFSADLFDGTAQITGTLTAFLDEDAAIYDKFVDEVESSLWTSFESADQSDFINWVMPRVKFNGADIDPPQSGAIPQSTPFEALEDSTYQTALWIQVSNS